ncbi:MAG: universal stress protein [Bacteroidetes Order II. Incertae sedis bacterium]|jgi:nucleotide-binding universal stress UspA family protein|nr:universal stress protein [Bacteroidetes Order II. bacterium]MBT4051719.1 universal stress protein [Bacteroidetes Order II. bacterium]MBT4602606.1 universal stress protein [Bacteroidetes Order II. bacterium]MBT5250749.1 universal stress protein [Bacteroidetes Order II. bacterium]MBT6199110.1 universal stress protein [Bacteroidetes Order II. bacterium]
MQPPPIKPVGKIVLVLSGPKVHARVLHEAVRLSTLLDAKLYAVHMRSPKAGNPSMMMEPLPAYTEEDIRLHFSTRGYEELAKTVPVRIFDSTNFPKLLAKITEEADLLIMGHKQRNRILAFLNPQSVKLQIADVVSCPVMVVPKVDAGE